MPVWKPEAVCRTTVLACQLSRYCYEQVASVQSCSLAACLIVSWSSKLSKRIGLTPLASIALALSSPRTSREMSASLIAACRVDNSTSRTEPPLSTIRENQRISH